MTENPGSDPSANNPPPPYGQPPQGSPYGSPPQGPPGYGQAPSGPPPAYGAPPAYGQGQPPAYGSPPPGYAAPQPGYPGAGPEMSDKSKTTAGILQILLGGLGIGRFYTGHTKKALLMILVTVLTCGIGSIWGLIDGILILVNGGTDANGRTLR